VHAHPAILQVTLLDFSPEHAASYNALVEVIRRNLLLADWCDDAHKEVRAGRRCSRQCSTLTVCVCVCFVLLHAYGMHALVCAS
jgi:hypothetical protein